MTETVGSIKIDASIDTAQFKKSASDVETQASTTSNIIGDKFGISADKANQAYSNMANSIKIAFVAIGAAGIATFKSLIDSTGDYESSLSQLQQASGATSEQMKLMSDKARALGQDTSLAGVTASDVAQSMLELSKAGLTVNDTLDASVGVLSLAKAGNIAFADAATIAASALNAFGLEGSQATEVADALAAGANASQADLSDLALGLQQSATVATQFGLKLNETVTALSLFANNGIKGSDAGTSLKTMLIALAKPTDSAASAMKRIGFEAYDTEGNFIGLEKMAAELSDGLKDLTDQEKQNTLATIFGTDAFRAAAILSENAGDSYASMATAVSKSGAATQAANAQLGPWQKSLEGAKNTLSELGLKIGEKVLPSLTKMANSFSQNLIPVLRTAKDAISSIAPLLTFLTITVVAYNVAMKAAAIAQGILNAVMALNPYVLVAAAIAALLIVMSKLISSANSSKSANDRLKIAEDNVKISTDNLKNAEQSLTDARLSREGSDIAVQRAEERLAELKGLDTTSSLDLKEAEYNLEVAKTNAAKASDAEAAAVTAAKDAKDADMKLKDDVVRINDEVANSANRVADGYYRIGYNVEQARIKAKAAGGSGSDIVKAGADASISSPFGKTFATGGFTGNGDTYEPAGVVHKGEYVLPRNMVNQSTGLPKSDSILSNGKQITINQTNNVSTEIDMNVVNRSLTWQLRRA